MSEIPQDVWEAADAAHYAATKAESTREEVNIIARAILAERERHAALSSAAVAEREPAYWAVHSKTGMHIGLWLHKSDADEALRGYEGGTIPPLYLDPPPTSELEAENARLRDRVAKLEKELGPYPSKKARHGDCERNKILNQASTDLENIINGHDTEISILGNDVWNRLDKLATDIEAHTARRVREGGKVDG